MTMLADLRNSSLVNELTEARDRYVRDNPLSYTAHVKAGEVMPGGNTRSVLYYSPFPLVMARGEGCYLWDLDGHKYLDMLGEYSAGIYGHSNATIRRALEEALDKGWNLGACNVFEPELAQLIQNRFPSIELVRFTNSGTEANLMAVATAVAATGKRSILVFDGGYHGGMLTFHGSRAVNVPHKWVVGQFNDAVGASALIDANVDDLAAIIVEPMLGSGGCIPGETDFLEALRAGADRTGAVLIFDEVMTSRLATGGLQARLGVMPDMTTLGKYIGGGMSIGAFGGRRELLERFDPTRSGCYSHSGTFNNNVLSMAAGAAGLRNVFTPDAVARLFERGEKLRAALNEICSKVSLQWTGMGSLLAAHFQDGPISRYADIKTDQGLKELLFLDLVGSGIYLARRGMVSLSLQVTDEDCSTFCAAISNFVGLRGHLL